MTLLTGAGVSAESGIPTFRDKQTGLWERFDAAELATSHAFERDAALVWGWYEWRRAMVLGAAPNPAHRAIAALARPYCENCRRPFLHAAAIPQIPAGGARIEPPRCETCGARIRPGVVWFGESLPQKEWNAACAAARRCDVFLCVGTSSMVQPAASLVDMAMASGATTVQINPNATAYDEPVSAAIRGMAGSVLPRILEAWDAARAQ